MYQRHQAVHVIDSGAHDQVECDACGILYMFADTEAHFESEYHCSETRKRGKTDRE